MYICKHNVCVFFKSYIELYISMYFSYLKSYHIVNGNLFGYFGIDLTEISRQLSQAMRCFNRIPKRGSSVDITMSLSECFFLMIDS